MSLKLKIGERYISRDGTEIVKIIRMANKSDCNYRKSHSFVDEDGYGYLPDGRSHVTKDYPFDLIALAPPRKRGSS